MAHADDAGDAADRFARELHDEFGQILTAVGMMLGRVRRKATSPSEAAAMAPFIADLEEAQQVTQRTLDRVRKKSRLLHRVILDDFGLQQAVPVHRRVRPPARHRHALRAGR